MNIIICGAGRVGFTIAKQVFTKPKHNWKNNHTIFLPSDEEEPTPATDPLALEEEDKQPRLTKPKKEV